MFLLDRLFGQRAPDCAVPRATKATPLYQPEDGRHLSKTQVESAIAAYLHEPNWFWVLIGPGEWLLAGTRYRVVSALDAPAPNIHVSKGYWGGVYTDIHKKSVENCKREAMRLAKQDLANGIEP